MLKYYVYAYLRKDGTPYYIGKGSGRRAYERHRKTLPLPSHITIMETGLSEIGALAIERRLIVWYGRKDLGTGILLNRTDGGDGARQGPLTCAKMSARSKERLNNPDWLASLKSRAQMTDNKREKLRAASLANGSCPPSQKGKTFWNNGKISSTSFDRPGPEWVQGRLRKIID